MKKILFVIVLAALVAGPALAQTAADHIRMGDEAYAVFDDAKALEHYQEALTLEPASYEALWKASRAMVDIADVIPVTPATKKSVEEQQKKMYTEATAIAKKAVAANPSDTWGHFQYAAANGKRLLLLGKKEQIDASKAVRAEIDKALELDQTNHLAWHAWMEPVSWQSGRTPSAAMTALRRTASATNRSFAEPSGASRTRLMAARKSGRR